MAERERVICASADLLDGGAGVRFECTRDDGGASAFAVRFGGRVRAYLNQCPHRGGELDWRAGDFFDAGGLYLVCATHGALFQPDTGRCVAGPCPGAHLRALGVCERDGQVVLTE